MKKDPEKELERKQETYNCSGICYTTCSMCPWTEECPETQKREGIANIIGMFGCALLFASPYIIIAALIAKFILN